MSATLVEPTVTLLALQAAALGAVLALLGLVIERSIERASLRLWRSGRGGPPAVRPVTDSSLNRSARVGSDDSTAIRVQRVPSTLDHASRLWTPGRKPGRKYEAPQFSGPEVVSSHDFDRTEPNREIERVINRSGRPGTGRAVSLGQLLFSGAAHAAAAGGAGKSSACECPAATTSRWFPPGTELRVLRSEQFESLVKRATDGLNRQLSAEPLRLVRARHRAHRWNGGVLTGETELVIARSSAGPADYELDPWSPAVVSATAKAAPGSQDGELPINPFAEPARTDRANSAITLDPAVDSMLGAGDSGKQSIWVDRYPRQGVRLAWELQAQKRTRGRKYPSGPSR